MAASSSVLDGVFGINKPIGLSSAQVIRDCQHHFNPSTFFKPMIEFETASRANEAQNRKQRRSHSKRDIRVKMGHGGTLDPLATGVLILGVGKGTKALQSFLDCTKTYETVVLFGASTDTYDRVGKILKKTSYDHITRPMVEEALNSFRGKIEQIPPLYSALKMAGKPLYEYAREGRPIPREIATREVEVTELELVDWYEPGEHSYRWPAEEATTFEQNFAEQVWKVEKQQMSSKKLTPEEEEEESKALKEHENFKRKADENVDALVYDRVNKRRRPPKQTPLMSGALGDLPAANPPPPGRGSNLIPEASDPNAPPPWEGKGPPAARIRMTVTSGFYVRSFCHDLGIKVGSAGIMAELCRSRQGVFVLGSSNCLEYSDLAKGEAVWAPQVRDALSQWNSSPTSVTTQALRALMVNRNHPTTEHEQDPSITKSKESDEIDGTMDSSSSKAHALLPSQNQNIETVEGSEPQETQGEETTKSEPTDVDADAVSWNGFADIPGALK